MALNCIQKKKNFHIEKRGFFIESYFLNNNTLLYNNINYDL